MDDDLAALEGCLGVAFSESGRELLRRALTHRSCVQEGDDISNERLEFLGDSVLGVVISRHLFEAYPEWSEGELTRAKAAVVSEPALAVAARRLGIGNYLHLSKGEEQCGGRERSSILCGAFEAIVATIYLEIGIQPAREFILRALAEPLQSVIRGDYNKDYKTLLQELVQENHHILPVYRVVEERGPDHNKSFVVEVCLGDEIMGVGTGKSKKEGEQAAAKQALEKHRCSQA
jgi:ribonuclease III